MKIKSPVLRFVAGSAVLASAATALVSLLYGVGSLRESWYVQEYPSTYARYGYGFWTAVEQGFLAVVSALLAGAVLLLVFFASQWIGNRVFGPRK
jgi:hypothetical protein